MDNARTYGGDKFPDGRDGRSRHEDGDLYNMFVPTHLAFDSPRFHVDYPCGLRQS
jgi:hypothetical protein